MLAGVEFSHKAVTQGATFIIQATTSEGPAQGPYVAARVGFEPATFRTTPQPPRPFNSIDALHVIIASSTSRPTREERARILFTHFDLFSCQRINPKTWTRVNRAYL